MKKKYFILLFVFGFSISLNSQPYNYKWVGSAVGNYSETSNWYDAVQSHYGIPAVNDNLIFDAGTTITVQNIPNSLSLGILDIKNFTIVEFQSSLNITIIYNEVNIEEGSSYNVTQTNFAVNLKCVKALISGTVILDGNNHSIEPVSSLSKLEFLPNSSFISGETLGAFPFGNTGGTVLFYNNSSYYHFGGGSPFSGTNVVTFDTESYYYIKGGDGSNEIFSGRTYGHIIIDTPNPISVISAASTEFSVFLFTTLTTLNGDLIFNGNTNDLVHIANGIEIGNGNVEFHCRGFSFINSSFVNTTNISSKLTFVLEGSDYNSEIISAGNILDINSDIEIQSSFTTTSIDSRGTINANESTIKLVNAKFALYSILITSHIDGFDGTFDGTVEYVNNTIFEYDGISGQSAGFTNYYTVPIGTMIIKNAVTLDKDIVVNDLVLADGTLFIENQKLTIANFIDYQHGTLAGNISSSVLEITSNRPGDFILNTDMFLNKLIISSGMNTFVKLKDNNILHIDTFSQIQGNFSLDTAVLEVNESFNLTGGSFSGSPYAELVFMPTVSYSDTLPANLVLGVLKISAMYPFVQGGNLTVNHLLKLTDGELIFSGNNLTIKGDIICVGGVLGCKGISSLIISGSGSVQSNLVFNQNDADDRNILNSFTLDRPDVIFLDSDLTIIDNINLAAGKLKLNNTVLNLSSVVNVTVISSSDPSYVITEGTGFISCSVPVGTNFKFPVGTLRSYAPVTINSSIANTFSVSVNDTVFSNGNFGEELLYNDLIKHTWKIEASDVSNSITSLSLEWEPVSQGSSFILTNSQLADYNSLNNEWDFFPVSAAAAGTLIVSNIDKYGYFIISSHQNELPASADNQVSTDLLTDYVFKESDFPITDSNDDALVKLKIENLVSDGKLYLDKDGNGTLTTDEVIFVSTEVFITDIRDSKLKYHPSGEGLFNFDFKISDGFNYSQSNYTMEILVSNNLADLVNDAIFYIPERSPNGTLVGQIQPITFGDALTYEVLSHENADAFKINQNGEVKVLNTDLLIKAIKPEFIYTIKACNSDSKCDEFILKIILKDALPVNLVATNYISPNDDGVNDTWIVSGIESGTYSVAIFDARGNRVFQSDNYLNEWNGTMNGTNLNSGVYYYIIRSSNIEKKGTITLVR